MAPLEPYEHGTDQDSLHHECAAKWYQGHEMQEFVP